MTENDLGPGRAGIEDSDSDEPAWHRQAAADVVRQLQVDADAGLDREEAARRRGKYGSNELPQSSGRGKLEILWDQVSGALVVVLIVAAGVSLFLREYSDAAVILAIIILNALLGFAQDYRAEQALAALKKMVVPQARVTRDGAIIEISSKELVPGDIVHLEAGNAVPADCRLLEAAALRIQEAALTGESEPVEKQTEALGDGSDLGLGDRTNMAYMSTLITAGHGLGIVIATGKQSQVGRIAEALGSVEREPTPLQRRLARLGRALAIIAIAIVSVVFIFGVLAGEDPRLMVMTALSLAVAVVPEGLPAVATAALAIAARRMFQRNALIRRLPAVETLGSVTVICTDKTGTLTENKMRVTELDVANKSLELSNEDANSHGQDDLPRPLNDESIALLMLGSALCNDAEISDNGSDADVDAVGDPTEVALADAAAEFGFHKRELLGSFPRIGEIPFSSDRKRMTTVHSIGEVEDHSQLTERVAKILAGFEGDSFSVTKGAVDRILDACSDVWVGDHSEPLDDAWRQRIGNAHDRLASRGMRVLGIATRGCSAPEASSVTLKSDSNDRQRSASRQSGVKNTDAPGGDITESIERDLVFVGMLGILDPPRAEVAEAVQRCQSAGIRPVMITGDHPLTAAYIAESLGIGNGKRAVTGQELEQAEGDELQTVADTCSVFARVDPHHKLKLVRALQSDGQVVAMTGDGVNDAPALKQAHIGVAMGITGTDVSKEAAQMILLDDNFATIVGAVAEGRTVYDNIRKFVKYTMTSNAGEITVMVLGPLLGMPLPLLPLQILWINLVTDGLPGLALVVEKPERDIMQRPPRPPEENILNRSLAIDILWIGGVMGVLSLFLGYWYWAYRGATNQEWRTMVFTVLTLAQMGNVMAIRSDTDSLFRVGIFSNRSLVAAVLLTFILQLLVVYWPPLQTLFKTTALPIPELLGCLAISTGVFWFVELRKWIVRRRKSSPAL